MCFHNFVEEVWSQFSKWYQTWDDHVLYSLENGVRWDVILNRKSMGSVIVVWFLMHSNRGSASNYWFDDNKRFEPVTNTVTKAFRTQLCENHICRGIIETGIGSKLTSNYIEQSFGRLRHRQNLYENKDASYRSKWDCLCDSKELFNITQLLFTSNNTISSNNSFTLIENKFRFFKTAKLEFRVTVY